MRRNSLSAAIVIIIVLALLTPLLAPIAKADTYSGSAQSSPLTYPACMAYLVVDTGAWTVNLRYDGPSVIAVPPGVWLQSSVSLWDDEGFARSDSFAPRYGDVTFAYLNSYTWVHAEVRWTFMCPAPWGFYFYTTTARIDIHVANGGGVSFSLREHAIYRPSYSPDIRFLKPSSGVLRIDSYQAGTTSLGTGWAFVVVPRDLLNGKYIRFRWSGYFSYYQPRVIAAAYIYDGEYDRANNADFPEGAGIPTKGAGLLQTLAQKNVGGSWGPETLDVLANVAAGTQSKCTIFFLMGDGWVQQTVYLDIDWFEINEGAGGSGRFTLENFDDVVKMERTGSYGDYGYIER